MANGNSAKLQFALEQSYAQEIAPVTTHQVRFSSEGFKWTPTRKEEGLLTGGVGKGREYIMGIKTEGDISTTVRPDEAPYWLGLALGKEEEPEYEDDMYLHFFKPITDADILAGMQHPSAYFVVDRGVEVKGYSGCKVESLSFSASAEDYLTVNMKIVGKEEIVAETNTLISPSPLKPYRFSGGQVIFNKKSDDEIVVADVTSVKFDYSNGLDTNTQTTSTGIYYKEPLPGAREVKVELEVLYSAESAGFRDLYLKSEATFRVDLRFYSSEELIEGEPYYLALKMNNCVMTDSNANVGGADRLKQTMSLTAIEANSKALMKVEFNNLSPDKYFGESSTG